MTERDQTSPPFGDDNDKDPNEFEETFDSNSFAANNEETRSHEGSVDAIGEQIGPYRILEKIGEGGMGSVYLAEQRKPFKRQVALKIIKAGMDSRQVIARFEAERQALAIMDHPNIAKVFEAGTTASGRPYFVMELVQGTPITKFCDNQKQGIDERLDLFRQVCNAVQHAHQKGIIHRDLTPNNILVTLQNDKPLPKVIDFGLAKATNQRLTEKTLFTAHGQVVGTPQYMSPEQANLNELDVDTRSDIYSLGVILYELLTGSTPLTRESLQNAGFMEILKRIKEEEPERPSSRISHSSDSLESISSVRQIEPAKFSSLMRGELDWIVMKTIEKDRTRRYKTANGLSEDIERFLNDDVVLARPPSPGYRIAKFAKKHRGLATFTFIAMCMVGVMLLAAYVANFWSINVSQRFMRSSIESSSIMRVSATVEEMDRALDAKIAMLKSYSLSALVQETLGESNVEFVGASLRATTEADNKRTPLESIAAARNLDAEPLLEERNAIWRSGDSIESADLATSFLTNKLSRDLLTWTKALEESEGYRVLDDVFFTNRYGGITAQMVLTSDYRQDDQEWWKQAVKDGIYIKRGTEHKQDGSAEPFSIDICLRVDNAYGEMIGVMKAVMTHEEILRIIDSRSKFYRQDERLILLNNNGGVIHVGNQAVTAYDVNEKYFDPIRSDQRAFVTYPVEPETGEDLLCVYVRSQERGLEWILLNERQLEDVFGPITALRTQLNWFFIWATLLSLIVGFVAATTYWHHEGSAIIGCTYFVARLFFILLILTMLLFLVLFMVSR